MNTKILINEYKALILFRETNIRSIISYTNGYTTFLGLVGTALSLLFNAQRFENSDVIYWISILIGFLFFLYGLRTFRIIYMGHENMIIYTRKLNITRNYLVGRNNKLEKMVLLPKSWKDVNFVRFGHDAKNYSKIGTLGTIKIINSLVISGIAFSSLILFIDTRISLLVKLALSLLLFIASNFLHNQWIKFSIKKSKKLWNKQMQASKFPEYFDDPNSD